MIPSIETICEDLAAGRITVQQAIEWMNAHASGAANELRIALAMAAMQGQIASNWDVQKEIIAEWSFAMADEMMKVGNV